MEVVADRAITIEAGDEADYGALARFHYRAGPPATIERVLRAVDREAGQVVGVLVVSCATLNATWRERAWPGAFGEGTPRQRAHALNRDLRCISRVIVEPRWRGLSIATRLVREYLHRPITRRTEAVAAMGEFCPFFKSAGMREVKAPPPRRDAVLAKELGNLGVMGWQLADLDRTRRLLRTRPSLRRTIVRWAQAGVGSPGTELEFAL